MWSITRGLYTSEPYLQEPVKMCHVMCDERSPEDRSPLPWYGSQETAAYSSQRDRKATDAARAMCWGPDWLSDMVSGQERGEGDFWKNGQPQDRSP